MIRAIFMENQDTGRREKLRDLTGADVSIEAWFRRHGPKADSFDTSTKSTLSPQGAAEVALGARARRIAEGGLFLRSSPVKRAIETADIILEDARERGLLGREGRKPEQKRTIRIRHELRQASAPIFDQKWDEIVAANTPPNFKELEGDERVAAIYSAEDAALDWWFSMGQETSDDIPPSRMIAAEMAVLVSRIIETSDKLWNGSAITEELVSHKSRLEPLLREILLRYVKDVRTGESKVVRGFDRINEIGGGMRYAEGWGIIVNTDTHRVKTVKIRLRGVDYDVDMAQLETLRREGIAMNRERRS